MGHTNRGKWAQKGVPHKGWTCVAMEDGGGRGHTMRICEMCKSAEIRYEHIMEHSDYPDALVVGCICAERMEEDYVNPRLREHKLKSAQKKRSNWVAKGWRISSRDNPYKNDGNFHVVVYQTHYSWMSRVKCKPLDHTETIGPYLPKNNLSSLPTTL